MTRGTRRADVRSRLMPRRLSRLGWFFLRVLDYFRVSIILIVVAGILVWGWAQGYFPVVSTWAHHKVAAIAAASAGMVVSDVIVEGRNRIDTGALKEAIGVEPGTPILAVDIDAVHDRLSSISWVKDVKVRRVFPDRLVVSITERLPAALWTDAPGGPVVIDDEGTVLTRGNISSFGVLLAIEGRGGSGEAGRLLSILKGQPDIAVRTKKAVRVSGRRWDIMLDNGTIVRLPEDDPGYALARASRAQAQEKILDQDYRAVDLHQHDRIILESKPGEKRDILLKGGNPR